MTRRATRGALAVVLWAVAAPACVIVEDDLDTGRVEFTWELEEAGSGAPVTCAPGESVQSVFGSFVDVYDCDDLGGLTAPIPGGDYLASFGLVDAAGFVLSEVTLGVSVFEGAVTDAGHFVFVVD